MFPGCDAAHVVVVADCDWYEDVATTKYFTNVRYNANFDRCRLVRLSACRHRKFVLWPADPLNDHDGDTKTVIYHHD